MNEIEAALARCDLFISIGTSGNVYPAAGFGQLARYAGAHTVEINLEDTRSGFNEVVLGPATTRVPEFFNSLQHNS
jgi:NAD-dependent deacetylase